jgi:ABC-type nitrate/sulfonate/bicarbonate transport system substrate-binding protein
MRCSSLLLVALLLLAGLTGCSRASSKAPAKEGLEVSQLRYQSNPGQISFAELAADLGYLAPLELVSVGNTFSGPADIQSVATGDTDIGIAFNGSVIKLIAAGAPIKAVVGAYGVDQETFSGFYTLEGSPIKSARDLIGKKVAMNTLGAHYELVLREYLQRSGLTPAEVKQVELNVLPPVNTEQALRAGQVDVAALGNTLREKALERGGLALLVSDLQLYGSFTAGSFVMHERFLREHPNTVRKFVEGVARAIEWARSTPREQVVAREVALVKKRDHVADAEFARYWRSTGIAGRGGLLAERELAMWSEWLQRDKVLRPGQLPLSRLYSNEFNPYGEHAGK